MSRRSRVRFASSIAVSVLVLWASIVAGCTSSTGGTPPTATGAAPAATGASSTAPKATPQGVLRVGISTVVLEHFDPFENPLSQLFRPLVFDTLVGETADAMDIGQVGGLAARWEQNADRTAWTFYLRKGVQWDNGYGEVTAEDVKFSMDRMIFGSGGAFTERPVYQAGIKDVEVVDPYTVRFNTKTPFPELPYYMSSIWAGIGTIVPKKAVESMGLEAWQRNPVGSGPYRMTKHEPGSYFKFEAREDHWAGAPRYKEIFLHIVPDDATRLAMLKRGELDIAEMNIPQLKEIEAAGFQTVEKKGGLELTANIFHMWEGPLAKREVRLALNLAVNKKELADKVFEGRAQPMGGDFPSNLLGSKDQKDLPPYPYDPQRAKELLAQAGYPQGLEIDITGAIEQAPLPMIAEVLAGYFKAIGINTKVKPIDTATQIASWRGGKLLNAVGPAWNPNRQFGLGSFQGRFTPKGTVTQVRDTDPEIATMVDALAKSATPDEIRQRQAKIQERIYNQVYWVYLVHAGQWFAASSKVKTQGWNGGEKENNSFGWRQIVAQ